MSGHCIQRIQRELHNLRPSIQWTATPRGGYDLMKWDGCIQNLDDPRHRGKKYRLVIEFPGNYPFVPPSVRFIDRVKCENVYVNGEVCLDILKDKWSPALGISPLMESLCSVLTDTPMTGDINKIPTTSEISIYNLNQIRSNYIPPFLPV